MAEDVAKLAIVVSARGSTESRKEIAKLKEEVNKLSEALKKKTETEQKSQVQTEKFARTLDNFKSTVVVSTGVVYGLARAYTSIEQSYVEQITSQVKLNAILGTTGNAIGYTSDQIEHMANAWRDATGIHETVLRDAFAITATFTKISREAVPDTIEAALSMSRVFGQDLKQSIIQLGTSLVDPVKGLGRLRRIGISFDQTQKDLIKGLIEQNDLYGAQKVILDEVNLETGRLAKTLGDTLVGDIESANSAWTDFKANLGGDLTQIVNPVRQGVTFVLDAINDAFEEGPILKSLQDKLNTYYSTLSNIPGLAGQNITQTAFGLPETVTIQEASVGLKELEKTYKDLLFTREKYNDPLNQTDPRFAATDQEKADNAFLLDQTRQLIEMYKQYISVREDLDLGGGDADAVDPRTGEQGTWLENLRQRIAYEKELLGITPQMSDLDKELAKNEAEKNKIITAGIALGLDRNTILQTLNNYYAENAERLKESAKYEEELKKAQEKDKFLKNIDELVAKKEAEYEINSKLTSAEKARAQAQIDANKAYTEAIALDLTENEANAVKNKLLEAYLKLVGQLEVADKRTEQEEALQEIMSMSASTYEENVSRVGELEKAHADGTISTEMYEKSVEELNKDLKDSKEVFSSLNDLLLHFATGGTKDAIDFSESLKETWESMASILINSGLDVVDETLLSIGEHLAGNKNAMDDWQSAMKQMIASTLEALGPQMMLAGLNMIIASGGTSVAGWGLFLAGGGTSILGGYLGYGEDANVSESGVSSAINYQDVDLSSSASTGRAVNVSVSTINNTSAEVTSRVVDDGAGGRAIEFVIDSAVRKTSNTFGLQTSPVNIA